MRSAKGNPGLRADAKDHEISADHATLVEWTRWATGRNVRPDVGVASPILVDRSDLAGTWPRQAGSRLWTKLGTRRC